MLPGMTETPEATPAPQANQGPPSQLMTIAMAQAGCEAVTLPDGSRLVQLSVANPLMVGSVLMDSATARRVADAIYAKANEVSPLLTNVSTFNG